MIETKYKPAQELKYSIGEGKKVAILSCGACANLCDIGGTRGMRFIETLLHKWGNTVVAARTIAACCPVPIMKEGQQIVLKSSGADVLAVISCAAGLKSAFLCAPKVPIVAVCDTVGAACLVNPENPIDELVAHSLCTSCGHCIIPYTFGICPLAACPSHRHYGPCSKSPENGSACAVDPSRDCVWKEIVARGADLDTLQRLKQMHKEEQQQRLPALKAKTSTAFLRKYVGVAGSRIPGKLIEMVHWAR